MIHPCHHLNYLLLLHVFSNFLFPSFQLQSAATRNTNSLHPKSLTCCKTSFYKNEYDALMKNGTWKLVDPPVGTKPIGYKWVYKNKYRSDGSLDKHKTRLVAKGYAQKEGIDYEEMFSPTAKWATICTLLSLASQKGWKVHQMDVKTAFLNGDLKDNFFMSQQKALL